MRTGLLGALVTALLLLAGCTGTYDVVINKNIRNGKYCVTTQKATKGTQRDQYILDKAAPRKEDCSLRLETWKAVRVGYPR